MLPPGRKILPRTQNRAEAKPSSRKKKAAEDFLWLPFAAGIFKGPLSILRGVVRAYTGSPGAPNRQGFLRPARQKTAGILTVLQGFLTPQGTKRPVEAVCREILDRL
jgi:hypothetical protein